ncbi:hypothetical protein AVEN_185045-1 [Araneus ventricosus]|uniref:Uncharacterized protein n=1 Tax=Araneus ventricosus TaxID=182803 RepID=A0A4Y2BQW3_ARAVE|nr:hypothetical protein AVEN_185045-1 [Araneus ventricosus]
MGISPSVPTRWNSDVYAVASPEACNGKRADRHRLSWRRDGRREKPEGLGSRVGYLKQEAATDYLLVVRLLLCNLKRHTEQAVEDADLTIVNTAISVAPQYDYVRVVGEDIDRLVLPTALPSTHSNVFFQKCGRRKTPDSYYSTTSFNHKFSNELLFIHAISGCDVTSALFGQGKNKFISLFLKHEELLNRAATFLNPQATTEQVTEAGENVLVALYGGDPATQNLDELRYHSFVKAAAKTKFNLARLPPTTDATQLHA